MNSELDPHFQEQLKRMIEDRDNYGSNQSGIHRGIQWSMRKPYNSYWCGYVKFESSITLSNEKIEEMERYAHGGFTSGIGFDCSHYDDFAPMYITELNKWFGLTEGSFKDYHYVRNCLEKIIDCFFEYQPETESFPDDD